MVRVKIFWLILSVTNEKELSKVKKPSKVK